MRLAIMQPYFLPYLGYFQLIHCADKLVLADEVQMIKRGWVARNRICQRGEVKNFTLPLGRHPHKAPICTVHPAQNFPQWRRKFLRCVRENYGRARNFEEVFALLVGWLADGSESIARINARSVAAIAGWLGIRTPIVATTAGYAMNGLLGLERLFALCHQEQASHYLNAPGGRHLYHAADFAAHGIELEFLEPVLRPYPQFSATFLPGLSILDLMMHVPRAEAHGHATAARIVPAAAR